MRGKEHPPTKSIKVLIKAILEVFEILPSLNLPLP